MRVVPFWGSPKLEKEVSLLHSYLDPPFRNAVFDPGRKCCNVTSVEVINECRIARILVHASNVTSIVML